MMSGRTIFHEGIIDKVGDQKVVVRFISNPPCGDCHAKGFCQVPATQDKYIDVATPGKSWMTGEKVRIILAQSHGFRAVFLAYLLPLIFVFSILVIIYALTHHEALAGILSLAILVPYYLILRKFRNILAKRFHFMITKY